MSDSKHFGVDIEHVSRWKVSLAMCMARYIVQIVSSIEDDEVFNMVRGCLLIGVLKDKR